MKHLLALILTLSIIFTLPLSASAAGGQGNIYTLDSITIEFNHSSSFSVDEQQLIVYYRVNGNTHSSTTYNLLCTLFGHKTTTETIGVIEHCVRDEAPRCIQTVEDVTACSRCDYIDIVELSSMYIYCCD